MFEEAEMGVGTVKVDYMPNTMKDFLENLKVMFVSGVLVASVITMGINTMSRDIHTEVFNGFIAIICVIILKGLDTK